ncbi:MAG: hypothetical protein AAF206_07305 [Bacteroidota bacterium]
MLRNLLFGILLATLALSCQDPGEIITVPDNTAPPDVTVSEVIKENYVNKLYISLLGRKPESSELVQGMATLAQDNASTANRAELMDDIFTNPGFGERMYDVARTEMLNNLDTAQISLQIYFLTVLLDSPAYEPFYDLIIQETTKLQELKDTPYDLIDGTIGRIEMHKRCVNNLFYDEINMGSQNFVLAMFEYFFNRYPTEVEERDAIAMVDGFTTLMFGKEGHSKTDFIQLFFASDDYFEGQVINVYRDFLFREPTSQEMGLHTTSYKQALDYQELLKAILTTDEYLGI